MLSSTRVSAMRDAAAAEPSQRPGWRVVLGSLARDRFALVSAIVLLLALICAIVGPSMFADEARKLNLRARNMAPFSLENGWMFVLGADALGRSLLARIIVAAQNTLLISATTVVIAAVFGSFLGLVAGYRGGWVGAVLLRLADAIMSFPSMLLAVIVLFVFEPGVINVILVLAISRMPIFLRTVRAEVLEIRERMFVQAARVMGASQTRILFRHILPNISSLLIIDATLNVATAVLAETGLSFFGFGIKSPDTSLGTLLSVGSRQATTFPWLFLPPAIAVVLLLLAVNAVGDGLRDALDPNSGAGGSSK